MKFRMRNLFAILMMALSFSALAGDERSRYGYWWYEEPPTENEEESLKLGPPPPEEELKKMRPGDFEKMLDDYRDYALMSDETEPTKWYYQMQDFARRRSKAFMNRTEMVMLQNGELNTNAEYSMTNSGREAREAQKNREIDNTLRREQNNVGLIMLSKKTCSYCPAQANVLKYFQQRHGWNISEIDIEERPDAARHFGASVTPTTIMVVKGSNQWFPVSIGVDSVPRIEENSYRALRMLRGKTTPSTFTLPSYQENSVFDPERTVQ